MIASQEMIQKESDQFWRVATALAEIRDMAAKRKTLIRMPSGETLESFCRQTLLKAGVS